MAKCDVEYILMNKEVYVHTYIKCVHNLQRLFKWQSLDLLLNDIFALEKLLYYQL